MEVEKNFCEKSFPKIQDNYKVLGEIVLQMKSPPMYILNCIFCSNSAFLRLDDFSLHIEENHQQELNEWQSLAAADDEDDGDGDGDGDKIYIKKETAVCSTATTTTKKNITFDKTNVNSDPLEENTCELLDDEMQETFMPEFEMKNEEEDKYIIKTEEEEESDDQVEAATEDDGNYENKNEEHFSTDEDWKESNTDDHYGEKFIIAFIAEYERERLLWDITSKMPESRMKRYEAYERIRNSLMEKHEIQLDVNDVPIWIRKLRARYRVELKKYKNSITKRRTEAYKPNLYFDKMSFLRKSIETRKCKSNKLHHKLDLDEDYSICSSTTPTPTSTSTSCIPDEKFIQLIEIYRNFPCLWDLNHIGYRFENQRKTALLEMFNLIKTELDLPNLTLVEFDRELADLHSICTREKQQKLLCEKTKDDFKPIFKFYNEIEFLLSMVCPFQCDVCDKVLYSYDKYRIHKSEHDGRKPFECPCCQFRFRNSNALKIHVRRHIGEMPYKCKNCDKCYATSSELKYHFRKHTGELPYFCEICGGFFRNPQRFNDHMNIHEGNPKYACTHCPKTFYKVHQLRRHIEIHKETRDQICNLCGKAYKTKRNLDQHKLIHQKTKKYACKICDKTFAQNSGLTQHMRTHGTLLKKTLK